MAVKMAEERYVALSSSKSRLVVDELNIEDETIEEHLMALCSFGGIARSRIASRVTFCRVEIPTFSAKQNSFTSRRLRSADSFESLS